MKHVLVVDDEPAICQLLQMALEADGSCRVTRAATPKEAIAVVQRDKPDAAIIDAILPATSGLCLARDVAALGVPVLIMTGAPNAKEQLDRIGCRFLWKPFGIGALRNETRALIDQGTHRCAELSFLLHGIAS